jgi:DNA-binding transcriptional ArsR family regulator
MQGGAVDATHAEKTELGDELAQVISNELTVKTLVYLVERAGSPKDIGVHLGESTSKVSHHVKKLERLRMVELIEERDLGGTIQHIYRAIVRPIVSNKEWTKLDLAVRQQYSIWIVRMILADAAVLTGPRSSVHPE